MATIQLNNDDLRTLIRESVTRLLESDEWQDIIPLCRVPYFVSIRFSDHAIEREYDRDISEDDVIADAQDVVRDIMRDFKARDVWNNMRVRIVNRETCVVSIVAVRGNMGDNKVHQLRVITSYIWDGRYNLPNIRNYYTSAPESEAWREAEEWNRENQDKVRDFTDWKGGYSVADQRRKAENEYYWRNHPREASQERRMGRLNAAFDSLERKRRHEIHDALPEGDLDAIRDYFKYFDRRQLSSTDSVNKELWADDYRKKMEAGALQEFVHEAARQALSEAFLDSTNANMAAAKRAVSVVNTSGDETGNDEFYTRREDVEKELPRYAEFFKGKSIYCPCDGPQSQIFQWFRDNFQSLGLNDLVATSFSFNGRGFIIYVDHDGNSHSGNLQGDGDFRSDESQRLMSKCDIVVTNPPFSLFSDIVNQCQKYGKRFLLLGNKNAASTNALFPLMRTGEVKYGYTRPGEFIQPEGDQVKRMGGLTRWFTNLPVKSDKRFSPTAEYDPMRHLRPDNEEDEVINVDSIRDIPRDYDGKMLVPITIFDQGLDFDEYDVLKLVRPVIGGKRKFVRVLIQKKQKEEEPALAQAVMNEVFKRLRKLI